MLVDYKINYFIINKMLTKYLFILLCANLLLVHTNSQICMFPCDSCQNGSTTKCSTCHPGFIKSGDYCAPQNCSILYCQTCAQNFTSICISCESNFILINNTCVCQTNYAPKVPGSLNTSCICPTPDNFNLNPVCISCPIQGCLTCQTSTVCQTCANGYQLTSGGSCSACYVSNCNICYCQYCYDSSSCSQCIYGYRLMMVNNTQYCMQCRISNCQTCSSANVCIQCQQGYTLINNTCTQNCQYPCSYCQNGICEQCYSPFNINRDDGTCFLCSVLNCQYCISQNTCQLCNYGYLLDSSNSSNCIANFWCSNQISYGVCNNCTALYVLSTNGICVPCQTTEACLTCSSSNLTLCTSCQPGFFLSNNICSPCPPLCQICNLTNCIQYIPGVLIINGQIILTNCLLPCICGNNSNICISCQQGYYLQDGSCFACQATSACRNCNSSVPQQCTVCQTGGVIIGGNICVYCDPYCNLCIGYNNCASCNHGMIVINGTCQPNPVCSQLCVNCDQDYCNQCIVGYTPGPNRSCLPAVAGCAQHYFNDPSFCLTCSFGTTPQPYTGKCVQCPIYCISCSITQICSQCYDGFYLTGKSDPVCAPNCKFPCLSCSYLDPSICLFCSAGYIFNPSFPNNCQPKTLCSSCTACPAGYALNSLSQCIACNSSCLTCSALYPTYCLSCVAGQYLQDGFCLPCMANCNNCTNPNYCLGCTSGFLRLSVSYNQTIPTKKCMPCQYPCQTCVLFTSYCTACVSGYLLAGSQCLNSNYYNLTIVLATNASNFFDSYQNLVYTLASTIVGSIYPGITMLFPTELSSNGNNTIYSLLISSQCLPQTACSQNEYNRVANLLSSPSIGNLTVIATQYSSSFDTINNSTNICPPTCNTCNNITGTCTSCASGFTLVGSICLNQTCVIPNCFKCSTNNVCSKCNPTFILTNNKCICQVGFDIVNGSCLCDPFNSAKLATTVHATANAPSCILCIVQNCLNCATSSDCSYCASPYTLNLNGICVICDIQDCISCSTNNYCTQCSGILQPNAMGNTCIGACTVPNCLNCISMGVCAACKNGYELNSLSNTCLLCFVSNCINCISDNVCSACQPGYILSADKKTCIFSSCSFPCSTCNNITQQCTSCISPPFNANPDPNGQCYTCDVLNCLTCAFNNTTVCLACSASFTLVNGICQSSCYLTGCLSCSSGNPTICQSCAQGFNLVSGSCNACPTGCLVCNSRINCITCMNGFYLMNSSCFACPSYCSSCFSAESCIQLSQTNGRVLAPTVDGSAILVLCDQGCSICASNKPSVCLQCQDGYYLASNNICQPCTLTSNCKTCSQTNTSLCLSCFANSQMSSNGICITCLAPCLTCSSKDNTLCLSCPKRYLLLNSSCLFNQCPLFCSTCTNASYCSQCISGFVSVDGICTPCLKGCSQCSITSHSVCITCLLGTYLDRSSNTCIGCPLNCQTCTPNGCTICVDGFYITDSLSCAPNCNIPCATCSNYDPNNCLSCTFGYIFDPTVTQNCRPDLACNYSLSCSGCPLGTVLVGTLCLACDQNCARCSLSNPMVCTSCLPNQFLNGSSRCQICPTGCHSCLSNTICLSCASGFTSIVEVSGNSPTQCSPCSPPCFTCRGSTQNCLTCQTNYSLQNGNCISNFNFGFSVTLSVSAQIFYQNYIAFLTELSANVQNNYGVVSVTSIKNGSIIVNGQISTTQSPETSDAQSQYQGLLNTLNVQSTIAGMTVIQSSVNTNGGSATPPPQGTSLAAWVIIVAVVVPLIITLIVIVGLMCYCKQKRRLKQQHHIQIQRQLDGRGIQMQIRNPIIYR